MSASERESIVALPFSGTHLAEPSLFSLLKTHMNHDGDGSARLSQRSSSAF